MRIALATSLLTLSACQAPVSEGAHDASEHGIHHRNDVTFAVGEFNEADERGARFGIDYERRSPDGWLNLLNEKWGLGMIADFYVNPVESLLLGGQAVYHPVPPVSMILAAGFNSNYDTETGRDAWLLRLGSRYSHPISTSMSLGPEIFYDVFEGGERRGVLALALSFGF